ncbi:MAG: response regulator [Pyrinomonadaceae bacterium]|nr:response regulator [Pyrinomonadaceae bacterium]
MRSNKMDFTFDTQNRTIFETVFAFFGTLSSAGFVLNLQGKVFDRTTTDPQLLIGQKFSETVYWQSSGHIPETLEKAIAAAAKGTNSKLLLDFRVGANEIINVEFYLQSLNTNEEIFFCAQEVTEREKAIEYHKTRSEHLLFAAENSEIGLWFWDLAGDEIFSTPKCNELFEIPPHEIFTYDSFLKIVHPEDVERVAAALHESQIHGREYNAEYRVIYSDGNIHWIAARGKAFLDADGNPKNMMGLVRKITDKKLANQELSKIHDREKKARSEAEEANRAKDFFFAVVSHELRSPLNAILGWSKILLTREVDETTRQNALETIERSARSQAKLIDDLVDSARVASGKLRLELRPINLYEIIKTVYFAQRPTADARKVNLEFKTDTEDIQVFGDSIRLQQIFTNLLTNSLKFTPEGGSIEITAQTGENDVKISVEDSGQGISAETLPNIFQQFQQGDNRTPRSQTGLGLGLSIVKILAEKHSGKIAAESAGIGLGSKFTVTLPLCGSKIDAIGEPEKRITRKDGKPLNEVKVLIVEDDSDSREVLQIYLEQSGANVTSASSAQQAMTILREPNGDLPDIIVSDLAMPEEDGYSLLSRIRKLPVKQGGAIPALALSAFASNDDKQKAATAGFQKYHTKPFEPDGIIEDIRELLKK